MSRKGRFRAALLICGASLPAGIGCLCLQALASRGAPVLWRTCHSSTLLGAALARDGAFPAVCCFMPFTLCGALIADFGAQGAELVGALATACHERCGQAADGGAVDVELNATCECLHLIVA